MILLHRLSSSRLIIMTAYTNNYDLISILLTFGVMPVSLLSKDAGVVMVMIAGDLNIMIK